jgi:hypothetical protein
VYRRLGLWLLFALGGTFACGRSLGTAGFGDGGMAGGRGGTSPAAGRGGPGGAGATGAGGIAVGVDGGMTSGSGGGGGQVADAGTTDTPPVTCPSTTPAPAPLRRLTRFEYNNTVRDLFMNTSRPADVLPADTWSNVAAEMPLAAIQVDGYHTLAHDFASAATKDAAAVAALLGCDPATAGEPACRQKLIGELVPRIFRRAPAADDAADFGDVFTTGQLLGGGFAGGVRAVLEVALQSPELLYRVEIGEPLGATAPGIARPAPYEMATRLSYLLWGSTPDAPLLAAAAAGQLSTNAQVAVQARRLLADPRARDVVRYFTFQLMHLHDADFLGAGLGNNQGFTADMARYVLEETRLYIDEVTWQGPGDFRTLLTSPASFLNAPLAGFYGVAGVSGDGFRRVDLDPTRRSGLLTQPSVLARTSHGTTTSPTQRGMMVLHDLLCVTLPAPPPDIPPLPPPSTGLTTRERLEQLTATPACNACHRITDSVGFAFEHYDAVGRWRDTENGQPIDATGALVVGDVQGTFDGAIELGARLARSKDAQSCYVGNWMTFAYGRREGPQDACSRRLLMEDFARTDGSVRELLVALTQTEAFLTRPLTTPQP